MRTRFAEINSNELRLPIGQCVVFFSFIFTYFFFFCSYIQKQNTRPYFIFFSYCCYLMFSHFLKRKQNYHHPSFNDDLKEKKPHVNLSFFRFVFLLFFLHIYICEYFSFVFLAFVDLGPVVCICLSIVCFFFFRKLQSSDMYVCVRV